MMPLSFPKLHHRLKADFPFASEDSHLVLPWIIAFMVYLATLFLVIGINTSQAVSSWSDYYSNTLTIQISDSAKQPDAIATSAMKTMAGMKDIKEVRQMREDEVKALVEPWLGSGSLLEILPIPVILEAQTSESADIAALKTALQKQFKFVEIDDHKHWIMEFQSLIRSTQVIAFLIVGIILAITVTIILFSTHTELKLHRKTLELLYSMGAMDHYIARQFQLNTLLLTLRGAIPGILAAGLTLGFLSYISAELDAPFLPMLNFSWGHLLLLILIAATATLLAFFAARIITLRTIREWM